MGGNDLLWLLREPPATKYTQFTSADKLLQHTTAQLKVNNIIRLL